MKEDYLWNKTGENREIKQLENALKAFRYQEDAPPEIPAKIITFAAKTRRIFFRFAFIACAAFFVIAFGIWLQITNKQPQIFSETAIKQMPTQEKNVETVKSLPVEKIDADIPFEKAVIYKQKFKPAFIKERKVVPVKMTTQTFKPKFMPVKLTKDEKYAYDQLMLALSITSSKLKLVKDKVDGLDEQNAVIEQENNSIRRK